MTDAQLRALLQRSPKFGQQALYEEYVAYVCVIVRSKLGTAGTEEDLEECVSDVFAEVFRSYDLHAEGSLKGYIAAVAKRRAIDCFRSISRRPEGVPIEEDSDSGQSVEREVEQNEQTQILLDCIQALGKPDADIILQKYFYGRNAVQIGKILGLSPVTVRVRCSRALKKLRTLLQNKGFTGSGGI